MVSELSTCSLPEDCSWGVKRSGWAAMSLTSDQVAISSLSAASGQHAASSTRANMFAAVHGGADVPLMACGLDQAWQLSTAGRVSTSRRRGFS